MQSPTLMQCLGLWEGQQGKDFWMQQQCRPCKEPAYRNPDAMVLLGPSGQSRAPMRLTDLCRLSFTLLARAPGCPDQILSNPSLSPLLLPGCAWDLS